MVAKKHPDISIVDNFGPFKRRQEWVLTDLRALWNRFNNMLRFIHLRLYRHSLLSVIDQRILIIVRVSHRCLCRHHSWWHPVLGWSGYLRSIQRNLLEITLRLSDVGLTVLNFNICVSLHLVNIVSESGWMSSVLSGNWWFVFRV